AVDLLANAQVPPLTRGNARCRPPGDDAVRPGLGARHVLLTSLPDLAADLLALVPHALALVRVGLAQLADIRGDFAHLLLGDALHHEPGGCLDPEGDPGWRGHRHGVTEAERELQVLTLGLDPVTHADDLHRLAVALGDARHHVGDQRPGQAVQRTDLALVAGPGHGDDAILLLDLDGGRHLEVQLALRALHVDLAATDGDVDAARDND